MHLNTHIEPTFLAVLCEPTAALPLSDSPNIRNLAKGCFGAALEDDRALPHLPVERPVRGFSDCKEGGSFGASRSLGLVGVAFRGDELNGWGGLVGVVLVVLAQENNFVVELAGGVLWP